MKIQSFVKINILPWGSQKKTSNLSESFGHAFFFKHTSFFFFDVLEVCIVAEAFIRQGIDKCNQGEEEECTHPHNSSLTNPSKLCTNWSKNIT
jgi:hypothetical protein